MSHPVIAVIGAGNMGSSLIAGLIKDGHPSNNIWATDAADEKLSYLQNKFHIQVTTDNLKAAESADVILFAVKPQLFAPVALELAPVILSRKPLVISVAAGIRTSSLEQWLSKNIAIVRCMPNTPALIGSGATALFANAHVTENQRNLAESIMRAVGVIVWLPNEDLMDTVTALSGNGPAYFFLMMEALQQAAVNLGLADETARLLTLQTALGAARMAIESGKPLSELRKNVTSPGGTTEKALSILEKNHFHDILYEALQAGKIRSEELAVLFDKEKS